MDISQRLHTLFRNAILLQFHTPDTAPLPLGGSKFGGQPHLPKDFQWPMFSTATYDDKQVRERPLSFLMQINLAEIVPYDRDGLLPSTGMLYFFYELDSQRWGFDPEDKGCARVFYVDVSPETLTALPFPGELGEDFRLPELEIAFSTQPNLPDWEEFAQENAEELDWETYDQARQQLGVSTPETCSKLLGYADIIQNCMLEECELVTRGSYTGSGWPDMTEAQRAQLAQDAQEWILLFQLDTVESGDFELMFGDCGRIYFYIRKQDLACQRFDQCWLILQCY